MRCLYCSTQASSSRRSKAMPCVPIGISVTDGTHLGVEPIAVHAEVVGRVPEANEPRLQRRHPHERLVGQGRYTLFPIGNRRLPRRRGAGSGGCAVRHHPALEFLDVNAHPASEDVGTKTSGGDCALQCPFREVDDRARLGERHQLQRGGSRGIHGHLQVVVGACCCADLQCALWQEGFRMEKNCWGVGGPRRQRIQRASSSRPRRRVSSGDAQGGLELLDRRAHQVVDLGEGPSVFRLTSGGIAPMTQATNSWKGPYSPCSPMPSNRRVGARPRCSYQMVARPRPSCMVAQFALPFGRPPGAPDDRPERRRRSHASRSYLAASMW